MLFYYVLPPFLRNRRVWNVLKDKYISFDCVDSAQVFLVESPTSSWIMFKFAN
jgi:hypothetical protein